MTLINRIQTEAKKQGYSSLKTVATKAGLSENAIYGWDRNDPKSENLQKVADLLHVSIDFLLERTDNPSIDGTAPKAPETLDEAVMQMFDGVPVELSEGEKQEILEFIRFKVQRDNNK